jgi:hypothetical protein
MSVFERYDVFTKVAKLQGISKVFPKKKKKKNTHMVL